MGGGNPFKKIGDTIGTVFTGGLNKLGSGGGPSAPIMGGQQSKMDMLVNSGGAPLLANITMGADVDQTLASFLKLSDGQYNEMVQNPNSPDGQAIRQLQNQLKGIQSNTQMKNKAIESLVNDFPNFMAQKAPEFAKMMDNETKAMMDQALSKVGAQFAAGGQLSSGATAEAAAKAGADIGMQRLQFGVGMAGQDWQNRYNEANALRNFQMNMLGQQSQQGFNAVQNALQQNTQVGMANAGFQNQQSLQNQQNQNAMWQGLGQLGGTVIGGMMGGPIGASLGGQVGQAGFSVPRLNTQGLDGLKNNGYSGVM